MRLTLCSMILCSMCRYYLMLPLALVTTLRAALGDFDPTMPDRIRVQCPLHLIPAPAQHGPVLWGHLQATFVLLLSIPPNVSCKYHILCLTCLPQLHSAMCALATK